MKPNLFKEKMTSLKLLNQSTGQLLSSLNNLDLYPASLSVIVDVDFFNLKANTDYILTVTAYFPNGTNYPVHATRVDIPEENLSFKTSDGYGKANGNFIFNLTLNSPSDVLLYFILMDENGVPVDDVYSYHSFGRW